MTVRGTGAEAAHYGGATGRAAPVVAATAAINGLGFSSQQTWAFWRAEASGMVETPFRCPNGEKATMVPVRTLPPRTQGGARLRALALDVLEQLAAPLARGGPNVRIGLALGISDRFAEPASRHLDRQRVRLETEIKHWFEERAQPLRAYMAIPQGHAALAAGALQGAAALAAGALDVVLVGGVETYYDAQVVSGLVAQQRLFDQENVDAFIPGEGAALLMLAAPATARHLGLPRSVELHSAAVAEEPGRRDSPIPCQGTGLAGAMRAVTDRLAAEQRQVDWLLADVTNESYRAQELALAFPRAFAPGGLDDGGRSFRPVATERLRTQFVPQRFGDLGAATMATAAVIACEAFVRGDPEAETCLITGSADGGRRGAVLLASRRAAARE